MINNNKMISVCFSAMILVGCGGDGDERRSTSNSSDLSGLWRMQITSAQSGLEAESNISFLLQESGSQLTMTDCNQRSTFNLNKENGEISGLPAGPYTIVNNDSLTASDDGVEASASKMALPITFDMGDLSLAAPELGNLTFTDLCVFSSEAKVLGFASQDLVSATTLLNGEPLLMEIAVMGNMSTGSYDLAREPAAGEASLRLKSTALKTPLNRTELTLVSGSLSISETGPVFTKGEFSGEMPNGSTLTGSFSLENP